ncbi:hypothetical protein K469DRAFT_760031 [Zopfia rhizophila CBS 207.26]|uniref:Uncharacterized protein n=1 Tax=Zopfia rhizophila CBS 207.26 TaxID=1314779 RepID=A0A6A6EHI4_9PEZI|nr:hypothetical protein K469DRAFT_760031 [Zopfia rhizophila CBS 207.26]
MLLEKDVVAALDIQTQTYTSTYGPLTTPEERKALQDTNGAASERPEDGLASSRILEVMGADVAEGYHSAKMLSQLGSRQNNADHETPSVLPKTSVPPVSRTPTPVLQDEDERRQQHDSSSSAIAASSLSSNKLKRQKPLDYSTGGMQTLTAIKAFPCIPKSLDEVVFKLDLADMTESKRNHQTTQYTADYLRCCEPRIWKDIKLFARHGGPDLSDLRSGLANAPPPSAETRKRLTRPSTLCRVWEIVSKLKEGLDRVVFR